MTAPKDEAKKVIDSLPEDSTYEEILKELAFDKMIGRGLDDVENGKTISNEEIEQVWIEESEIRYQAIQDGTMKTVSYEEVFAK